VHRYFEGQAAQVEKKGHFSLLVFLKVFLNFFEQNSIYLHKNVLKKIFLKLMQKMSTK